jgi:hypothetical protein
MGLKDSLDLDIKVWLPLIYFLVCQSTLLSSTSWYVYCVAIIHCCIHEISISEGKETIQKAHAHASEDSHEQELISEWGP